MGDLSRVQNAIKHATMNGVNAALDHICTSRYGRFCIRTADLEGLDPILDKGSSIEMDYGCHTIVIRCAVTITHKVPHV